MANSNSTTIETVDRASTNHTNTHYLSNAAPLVPSAFIKLPVGSIRPQGWMLETLKRMRDGLCGNLTHISAWLRKENNAWLSPDGKGDRGWEEVPYWLRGFANLGIILEDEKILEETKIWIEGALNSQRPNGDFGADKYQKDGNRDYWGNAVMLYVLQSWYEYTNDERIIALMQKYFRHLADDVPDEKFLTGYWQRIRGGDLMYSVLWLYNITKEDWMLDFVHKIHRNTANWSEENHLPDWHNVNIAQAFREPATYYTLTKDPKHLKASYANFDYVINLFGQMPGGMWAGDENSRLKCDDPRQAIETCGVVEQMLSDEIMLRITGDPVWADHAEKVAFNTAPATMLADSTGLRYLTAPNHVISDALDHAPGYENKGPFVLMSPLSSRCCQHNHSQGWPYYSENICMATPDNGVATMLYVASDTTLKVGDGQQVTLHMNTNYPFEEEIRISVETQQAAHFPIYLRVPSWAKGSQLMLNGQIVATEEAAGKYIKIERTWDSGDTIVLTLPMQLGVTRWSKNHQSATVQFGPLEFSLEINEIYKKVDPSTTAIWDSEWQSGIDDNKWAAQEILPGSNWNYGLVYNPDDLAASFAIEWSDWPADDFPFTLENVPIRITAKGKKIPEWDLDEHGIAAELRDSPVISNEPLEDIVLVPMGAARLRVSSMPVIGEKPEAFHWNNHSS